MAIWNRSHGGQQVGPPPLTTLTSCQIRSWAACFHSEAWEGCLKKKKNIRASQACPIKVSHTVAALSIHSVSQPLLRLNDLIHQHISQNGCEMTFHPDKHHHCLLQDVKRTAVASETMEPSLLWTRAFSWTFWAVAMRQQWPATKAPLWCYRNTLLLKARRRQPHKEWRRQQTGLYVAFTA